MTLSAEQAEEVKSPETGSVVKDDYIGSALKEYKLSDAVITQLSEEYLPLTIDGLEDTEGYKVVNAARVKVKKLRVNVEKKRKELKAESLAFGKAIDGEAKRITEKLEPIEEHLVKLQADIDNEKQRIADEIIEAERKRIQNRKDSLFNAGMTFNGEVYIYSGITMSEDKLKLIDDNYFQTIVDQVQSAVIVETERLAQIAKQAEDNERIRLEQEAKAVELKAEEDRLEEQRKAIIEAERIAEIKQEEVVVHEEEKAEDTVETVIEVEETAPEEIRPEIQVDGKCTLEVHPDIKLINDFARSLSIITPPVLELPESKLILKRATDLVNEAIKVIDMAVSYKPTSSSEGFSWGQ